MIGTVAPGGGQVLDKFLKLLKGTPGQKRTTKSASQTVEPPGTPLPEPELNRQTQQSSRSAHRRAWRCADVDTLNIQSVTPSTRHQAGLDFRPRDCRSEPHCPALKTSRAALVAHAAGARAPTAGETRAGERRTPGERRHRPQGGGARGLVPEAERDSAETAGPLPATTQDAFNDIVLGGR